MSTDLHVGIWLWIPKPLGEKWWIPRELELQDFVKLPLSLLSSPFLFRHGFLEMLAFISVFAPILSSCDRIFVCSRWAWRFSWISSCCSYLGLSFLCVLAEWGVGGGKMNICRGQRSTLVSSQPFFFFFLCVTGSLTEHAFTFQQAWLASEAPSSQGSPFPVLQVHTVVPKCCTVWLGIWIQVLLHLLKLSYGLSRLSKLPSLGFSFCMELDSSCPSVCLCLSNILELLDPCCLPTSARSQGVPIISLQTQYEIVHGAQSLKKFFRSQVSFLNDSITLQVSESL